MEPWIKFHELVHNEQFPLDNICFRLFLDVARYIGCTTTTQMRYCKEIKEFWYTGYKLFHGKFLRFMGGPKNHGSVVGMQAERGNYDPKVSMINFAVPDGI